MVGTVRGAVASEGGRIEARFIGKHIDHMPLNSGHCINGACNDLPCANCSSQSVPANLLFLPNNESLEFFATLKRLVQVPEYLLNRVC